MDLSFRALNAQFCHIGDAWQLAFRLQWDALTEAFEVVGTVAAR